MRYLTLVILLVLAPLGWGEDVYYCVEEHRAQLAPTDSGDAYELTRYKTEPFTFKYEADANRLAIKGYYWGGDELFYLDCAACYPELDGFNARDGSILFLLDNGRFIYTGASYTAAAMTTGTCTKF